MPCTFREYCNGCPYHDSVHLLQSGLRSPLSMEYRPDTAALLIFQAPGCHEWVERRPICSNRSHSAAARIRNSLRRINARRCDFSITNAVQCYPGKGGRGRDKPPRQPALRQCANWLRKDIEGHPWRRIVVFGAKARESVIELGYNDDERFRFILHPSSGRLSNCVLNDALRWALER